MTDDTELLRRYAEEGSEVAFADFVQRHIAFVYASALRRTNGDGHRAVEVAQLVFADAARRARSLSRHPVVSAWLYVATRNVALNLQRAEARRHKRERGAQMMSDQLGPGEPATDWERLRPVLDAAMDDLADKDREAVLLRFFENQPFAAIGVRLQLTDNAARMRIERALARLRAALARRGVNSTAAALAAALANQVGVAAPPGLAASITGAALAGVTNAGGSVATVGNIFYFMNTTKALASIAGIVAIFAVGAAFVEMKTAREAEMSLTWLSRERGLLSKRLQQSEQQTTELEKESDTMRGKLATLTAQIAAVNQAGSKAAFPADNRSPQAIVGRPALVLTNPQARALYIEAERARQRARYNQFFAAADLSSEQREKFITKISELLENELDALELSKTQNLTSLEASSKMKMLLNEGRQKNALDVQSLLGNETYEQYYAYTRTLVQRQVVDQLASRLYYTDVPLTAQQGDQLAQVFWEDNRDNYTRSATSAAIGTVNGSMNGEPIPQAALNDYQTIARAKGEEVPTLITDAVVARAQASLTSVQLAALKQLQAEQWVQIKLAPVRLGKSPGGS